MKQDDVTTVAYKDWLIIRLGMYMFQQHGLSHKHLISQRMRILSRLLTEVRRATGRIGLGLRECISPYMFDDIVNAVHELCKID